MPTIVPAPVIRGERRAVFAGPSNGPHPASAARITMLLRQAIVLLPCLALLTGCQSIARREPPACMHRNAEIEKSIGFCQAVRAGELLYISGVVGAGPMDAAVARVYQTLGEILAANGLSFADVVKENVYATDLDAFIKLAESRKAHYQGTLPAATWVQVQRLFQPAFVLEVELVARYAR